MAVHRLCDEAVGLLEPYIGRSLAEICINGTAVSLGKTSEDLCRDDLPVLYERIRGILAPITSGTTIEGLLFQLGVKTI
ncbi:MAG: hypothetical protein PF636_10815 [Actinomycetota bacterium]|jgi:hypothetical protein|nr:hypothetical protein [Actinomycetota bacterium]